MRIYKLIYGDWHERHYDYVIADSEKEAISKSPNYQESIKNDNNYGIVKVSENDLYSILTCNDIYRKRLLEIIQLKECHFNTLKDIDEIKIQNENIYVEYNFYDIFDYNCGTFTFPIEWLFMSKEETEQLYKELEEVK